MLNNVDDNLEQCQTRSQSLFNTALIYIIMYINAVLNNDWERVWNNVGSKTLFNDVFIRPEQVVRFWLCTGCIKNCKILHLGFRMSGQVCLSQTGEYGDTTELSIIDLINSVESRS